MSRHLDGKIRSMIGASPDGWAAGWFEYHRLSAGTREQRKALSLGQPVAVQAAHDWVEDRVMDGGQDAIDVIEELAEAVSTEDQRSIVGIGLVEALIYEHGDAVIDPLLTRARRSQALTEALSWVSLASGSVSDESVARLARYQRAHRPWKRALMPR